MVQYHPDDMMDPTDIDEDTVNITATSSVSSHESETTIANVTGPDGKFGISKVKTWSLPKINPIDSSLHDSFVSNRTKDSS